MEKIYFSVKPVFRVLFLLFLLTSLNLKLKSQNIVITDDDGYTVNPSAMLDVKSTTKGLLIPRLLTSERIVISSPAKGLLVFDTDEAVFYYFDGYVWVNLSKGQVWSVNSDYVILSNENGKVGIGTSTPNSKLEVKADASFTESDTLFAVKDKNGNIVFAVFPDGAKVYVNEGAKGTVGGFAVSGRNPAKATVEENYLKVTPDSTRIWVNEAAKGSVGGFAVSGRNPAKSTILNYFVTTADSTRIYINDTSTTKGTVGGFAVSGRNPSKGGFNEYFVATPDSTRVYINEGAKGTVGGFAVSGRNPSKGITDNYMQISKDSTRIYIEEGGTKGTVGGFAVSGRNPSKGITNDYFNVSGNLSATEINNEPRVMWYPQKAALLAGEVHVGSADSVGTNSTALGYRSISKGEYSQAMGYRSQALGKNSTAIGNNAIAFAENSFAMGDSAFAIGIGSYAFGTTGLDTTSGEPTTVQTIANGNHSFAFGFGSYADTVGCVAIGTDAAAIGKFSMALGLNDTAYADFSFAIGANSISSGDYSFAIGASNQATKAGAYAIGSESVASGVGAFAIGYQDTASAASAFAMGFNTNATEFFATAMGAGSEASGYGSTAMGYNTSATNSYATSFGRATEAGGASSTAFGYLSVASGKRAVAGGYSTLASGEASTAFGNLTEASDYFATSFGASTVASGHTSTAMGNTITVSGDNSFGIGLNATSYTVSQNNTFAVMGGKMGIGTTAPDYALDVAGYANIAKGVIGAGAIVFRVDGDEALWYNGSVFSWGAGATSHNYFQDNVSIGVSTSAYPLTVDGTANLNSGVTSGTVLRANGAEAIYYTGSRFNWGSGGSYNYFPDEVGIGTTNTDAGRLNIAGSAPVVKITHSSSSGGQAIRFANNIGTMGNIYITTTGVNYNGFTGSHFANIEGKLEKGQLISLTGVNTYIYKKENSEIIYGGRISIKPNSQNILGAFLENIDLDDDKKCDLIMAVGNGVMWVVDNGENLEAGDYLISSSVAGHAMKDIGDYKIANIVARVAEPVDWTNETAQINGVKHKLISVFFENFKLNYSDDDLLNKIKSLEETNHELLKRLELIEEKINKKE